jgi:hypothetical protein
MKPYCALTRNGISTTKKIIKQTTNITKIEPLFIEFTIKGLEYWKKYGITDLSNIRQVKGYVINDNPIIFSKTAFCYVYNKDVNGNDIEPQYKIFIPNNGKTEWIGTVKGDSTWYINNNSNCLFIAKSAKCQKVVKSILGNNFDYLHHQSEMIVNSPFMDIISKYKTIYLMLDKDKVGIENANKFKEKYKDLNIILLYSVTKDISDMVLLCGDYTKEYLTNLI